MVVGWYCDYGSTHLQLPLDLSEVHAHAHTQCTLHAQHLKIGCAKVNSHSGESPFRELISSIGSAAVAVATSAARLKASNCPRSNDKRHSVHIY